MLPELLKGICGLHEGLVKKGTVFGVKSGKRLTLDWIKKRLIKMHSLRDNLRTLKAFNPFSDKFDAQLILKNVKLILSDPTQHNIETLSLAETASCTIILNQFYKNAYDFLGKNIKEINLKHEEIIWSQIALRNRHCILSNKLSLESDIESKEIHFEDRFKKKIDSFDKSIGRINASGALETEIDGLHILLNYLKYFENSSKEVDIAAPKIQTIEQISWQSIVATFYYVLKSSYDDAIWKDGYIKYDKTTKSISIKFENAENLKLFRIGYIRLENNCLGFLLTGKSMIDNNQFGGIRENDKHRKQHTKISTVKITNGYLKYKLAHSKDNEYLEQLVELANESSILAFYSYLDNVNLPRLPGFDIRKLIAYFNVLLHLFIKAAKCPIPYNGVFKKSDLFRFPFRIKWNDLKFYLLRRTNGSDGEIETFLNFLVNSQRVNFWNKQFIRVKDDLYFLLLPLTQPNILYLVDQWLEEGGFNLDARGGFFETYIKHTLIKSLKKKGYNYRIPKRSKFECKNGKEQIDLIIVLKHIIIVAEIKCIRYPFEPREISNSELRLKNGAVQAKRKTDFIKDNFVEFESDLGALEGRRFVSLVITNYPLFSGRSFDNIPVIDFLLMDAYFSEGVLSNNKLTTDSKKNITIETVSSINFHSNEDEFSNNFEDKMRNPPAILEKKSLIEIKNQKISLEFFNFQIYVETADFKE